MPRFLRKFEWRSSRSSGVLPSFSRALYSRSSSATSRCYSTSMQRKERSGSRSEMRIPVPVFIEWFGYGYMDNFALRTWGFPSLDGLSTFTPRYIHSYMMSLPPSLPPSPFLLLVHPFNDALLFAVLTVHVRLAFLPFTLLMFQTTRMTKK
jgi:hypothetical protein